MIPCFNQLFWLTKQILVLIPLDRRRFLEPEFFRKKNISGIWRVADPIAKMN